MRRTVLILGGARSGKSAYAERMVTESGLPRTYVATAEAGDAEMRERIEHHRTRRGAGWITVEEPALLEATLPRHSGEGRAVLVDCLTLWLSNVMHLGGDVEGRTDRLCRTLDDLAGLCVLVANEVGLGLVPENPLGRRFRDAQGRLNQAVAAVATDVVFVAAGLPLVLKGMHA